MAEQTYYLFVGTDGQEFTFFERMVEVPGHTFQPFFRAPRVHPRELPHIEITLRGEYEYTTTRDHSGPRCGELIPNRPRGRGWEIFDSSSDKKTTWRRPVASRSQSQEPMTLYATLRADGTVVRHYPNS
jgi:hypothetical protein